MPKNRWVVVSTEGLDAEEVARPRTQELECPSCDRLVRFVEKELVRNLRVFGVPLVGVERGRRVLECPSCRACIEPPDGLAEAPDDAERQQLRAKVLEARDEHWLWQRRAEKCVERGDDELATEALRMAKRAAAELERLEAELNRGSRVTKGSESKRGGEEDAPRARPVVVARPAPSGTGVVETHDDAFAALKAKVAKRAADETARDQAGYAERMADIAEQEALRAREEAAARAEDEAARAELSKREAAPAPAAHDTTEDDFAALKAKLAGRAAAAPARPAPPDDEEEDETAALKAKLAGRAAPALAAAAPAPAAPSMDFGPSVPSMPAPVVPAMPAPEPAPVPASPAPVTSVDDDFAALKARIASRAASSAPEAAKDTSAYEALRREMSQPAPAPAPVAAATPAAAASSDDDDDPVAALKRKLRKK